MTRFYPPPPLFRAATLGVLLVTVGCSPRTACHGGLVYTETEYGSDVYRKGYYADRGDIPCIDRSKKEQQP